MQVPLQVTFRNTAPSEAVEAEVRKRVEKLNRYHGNIVSCRVVVEAPLPNKQKGGLYKIRIDLTCPESKIEVNRDPDPRNQAHEDVYVALRDAFDAANRKLEQYTARRKGEVKQHEESASLGKITHLSPMEDYGTITTPDLREIYFHRNSVLNAAFDSLNIGAKVSFREEDGDKGPQASSVKVV
ncbi:HPF/RaiA family ribosome-associated protein [Desulfobulbus propionicus]|jgi:ribosomal subunit interface protein